MVLKEGDYLIGSFQRDTEGFDRKSPKLVKGPDIFIEIVKQLNKKHNNLKVILSGKRRIMSYQSCIKTKSTTNILKWLIFQH